MEDCRLAEINSKQVLIVYINFKDKFDQYSDQNATYINTVKVDQI